MNNYLWHFDGATWQLQDAIPDVGSNDQAKDVLEMSQGLVALIGNRMHTLKSGSWSSVEVCTQCLPATIERGRETPTVWALDVDGRQSVPYEVQGTKVVAGAPVATESYLRQSFFDGQTTWLRGGRHVVSTTGYRSRTHELRSVWASSGERAWFAGYEDLFADPSAPALQQYQDGVFSEGPPAASVHGWGAEQAIIGDAMSQVGQLASGAWTYQNVFPSPPGPIAKVYPITEVLAVSATEQYATVGLTTASANQDVIVGFDGTSWTDRGFLSWPHWLYAPGNGDLYAAETGGVRILKQGAPPSTIPAAGTTAMAALDAQHIYVFSGLTLGEISSGAFVALGDPRPFNASALCPLAPERMLVASPDGDTWLVDGDQHTKVALPSTLPLNAFYRLADGHIWAVGEGGAVLRYDP
jgi:hypothetical protein